MGKEGNLEENIFSFPEKMGNSESGGKTYLLRFYNSQKSFRRPYKALQYISRVKLEKAVCTDIELIEILGDAFTRSKLKRRRGVSTDVLMMRLIEKFWKEYSLLNIIEFLRVIPKKRVCLEILEELNKRKIVSCPHEFLNQAIEYFREQDKYSALLALLENVEQITSSSSLELRRSMSTGKTSQERTVLIALLEKKITQFTPEIFVEVISLTESQDEVIGRHSDFVRAHAIEILNLSSENDRYHLFKMMFRYFSAGSVVEILKLFPLKGRLLIFATLEERYKAEELEDAYRFIASNHDGDEMFQELIRHHREIRKEDLDLISRIIGKTFVPKIQIIEEKIPSDQLCKVCAQRQKNVVFLPCKHYCTCATCAERIEMKCPICREKIAEIQNIFDV